MIRGKMLQIRYHNICGARSAMPDKYRAVSRAHSLDIRRRAGSRKHIIGKIIVLSIVIMAMLSFCIISFAWPQRTIYVKNYDGDTFTAHAFGGRITVRVADIDAPERADRRGRWPEQPWAEEARAAAAAWLAGERLRLIPTGTSGNRLVARVRARGGRDLARALVRAGLAWVDPRYCRDDDLVQLQAEARAARRGLWSDPHPVAPWEWRRGRRR